MNTSVDQILAELPQVTRAEKKSQIELLHKIGAPSSKSEDYTYVDTALLKDYLGPPADTTELKPDEKQIQNGLLPITGTHKVVIINGRFSSTLSDFPKEVLQVSDTVTSTGNLLPFKQKDELRYLSKGDFFSNLNQIYSQGATHIVIAPDADIESPVEILNMSWTDKGLSSPRIDNDIAVHAGKNSRVNIVYSSAIRDAGSSIMQNSLVRFYLDEKAQVEGTFHSSAGADNLEFNRIQWTLEKNARFTGHKFTRGSQLTRYSLEARLMGHQAVFTWNSSSVATDSRQAHEHLIIHHNVPETISHQNVKNILRDKSRVSFDGTVVVHPNAQKSDSSQLINNLMLSDQARSNTKPNLMIFADDVKCTHGATVGGLDPDQLFYLQSRGLDRQSSQAILTESYLNTHINRISHPVIQNLISRIIKANS